MDRAKVETNSVIRTHAPSLTPFPSCSLEVNRESEDDILMLCKERPPEDIVRVVEIIPQEERSTLAYLLE